MLVLVLSSCIAVVNGVTAPCYTPVCTIGVDEHTRLVTGGSLTDGSANSMNFLNSSQLCGGVNNNICTYTTNSVDTTYVTCGSFLVSYKVDNSPTYVIASYSNVQTDGAPCAAMGWHWIQFNNPQLNYCISNSGALIYGQTIRDAVTSIIAFKGTPISPPIPCAHTPVITCPTNSSMGCIVYSDHLRCNGNPIAHDEIGNTLYFNIYTENMSAGQFFHYDWRYCQSGACYATDAVHTQIVNDYSCNIFDHALPPASQLVLYAGTRAIPFNVTFGQVVTADQEYNIVFQWNGNPVFIIGGWMKMISYFNNTYNLPNADIASLCTRWGGYYYNDPNFHGQCNFDTPCKPLVLSPQVTTTTTTTLATTTTVMVTTTTSNHVTTLSPGDTSLMKNEGDISAGSLANILIPTMLALALHLLY